MIQRIQSLFLLIVILLSVFLFFVPIYALETPQVPGNNGAGGLLFFYITSNVAYLVLNAITGFLALIILFLFKNRYLQIRLCNLNMLFICIFIGTLLLADHTRAATNVIVHYDFGCYFPLLQLVFTFFAMRATRKDEALVRSADRLR
jgi:hypothetical protein